MAKPKDSEYISSIGREDFIYLAGLIDGDGCFIISKRRSPPRNDHTNYIVKLQVHCITEWLIDWILETFGGHKTIHHNKARSGRRTLYGAEITGDRLTKTCERLIPFLKLKKLNAENMLEMRKTYTSFGGRVPVPQESQQTREKCFLRSQQLNTHKSLNILAPCLPSALSSEEFQVN